MPPAEKRRACADAIAEALHGSPALVTGVTFLARSALGVTSRGEGRMPGPLVSACERLRADLAFVPAGEVWADEAADRVAAVGSCVFWVVDGPLGSLAHANGYAETLKRTAADPDGARADLEAALEVLLPAVDRGARLGASAIVVAEDLAGASGMLVSPDFAIEILAPLLSVLADRAAQHSLPTLLHSDGDTRVLLHVLRRAGFTGVHPGGLDARAFDGFLTASRREGLSVLGGIPGAELREGGDAAVRAGERAALLAEAGGLLVSDDGGISTPAELVALEVALAASRRHA